MLGCSLNVETNKASADVRLVISLPIRISASQYATGLRRSTLCNYYYGFVV
jgi:hypothetical protein